MKESIIEILEALGYEKIVSKNQYMLSFKKGDIRVNYYFTTGTLSIEGKHVVSRYIRNATPSLIEEFL